MIINFSPVFADDSIVAFVAGDKITINDQEFDFTPLQPGLVLPPDAIESIHFVGPVSRLESGELEMTLRLPHATTASDNVKFPEPVRALKGRVRIPKDQTPPPETLPPVIEPEAPVEVSE